MGGRCSTPPTAEEVEEVTVALTIDLPYDTHVAEDHKVYTFPDNRPKNQSWKHSITIKVPRGGIRVVPVWKVEEHNGVEVRVKVCDITFMHDSHGTSSTITERYVRFWNAKTVESVTPGAKVVVS